MFGGGSSVNPPEALPFPYMPVSTTAVWLATAVVEIANDAEVAPGSTWTTAGTIAAGDELVSATSAPEGGAGAESVTEPVEPVPPTTAGGVAVTDEGGGRSA